MLINFCQVVARVLAFLVLPLLIACGTKGISVYVAPDGSDSNDGTKAKPLATIEKARDVLRGMATDEPKNIILRGGKYYNVSVTFAAEDAGLSVTSERGENAVLYGGKPVTGWEKDGENFYAADVPGVKEGSWDFRFLIVNESYRLRARYPETGALSHLNEFKVRWMSTTGGGWERKPTEEELTTMNYKKEDLGPWLETRNAELTIYHQWDESLVGVKSIDTKKGVIRFSTPAGHPPGAFYSSPKAKTYVIWNIREGMTKPGQWYLDRARGKLVYFPRPEEDMAKAEVIAPSTERIITLEEGANNVTIRGLTIAATTTPLVAGGFGASRFDGAITGNKVADCTLEDLMIKNVGGWGIKLSGMQNRIMRSEITGTGAGGIGWRGGKFLISHNHIHEIGVTYPSAIALSGGGREGSSEISYNEIHNTPYSAVTCSGEGHVIQYNKIYDMMRELFDGGGIYITFCKNITLRGNFIFGNNPDFKRHAYYLDEQAENCVVENNVALNTVSPLHNHMAKNDTIRNNIFVDEGKSHIAYHRCEGYYFGNNIISAGDSITVYDPEAMKTMPNNIFYSAAGIMLKETGRGGYSSEGFSALELRDGSRNVDPMIEAGASGKVTFKSGSPAPEMEIRPVDGSGAGPQ